eukprot:1158402-Pelagomonas_calceolata.AAC.3
MGQCGAPGGDAGPGSKNACAGCKTPEAPILRLHKSTVEHCTQQSGCDIRRVVRHCVVLYGQIIIFFQGAYKQEIQIFLFSKSAHL